MDKKIIEIVTKNPGNDYGLLLSAWSLHVLAGFLLNDMRLVDTINHTEVRNILLTYDNKWG
ncbi:MAG TPA: hypothetical protein VIY08_04985 [Candidatus Nitrosocosmicus sp.]